MNDGRFFRELVEYSSAQPTKRAFDRVESNDFGLFKRVSAKRAFDRLDMADFGFRKKRAFDRIARAEFGFEGLRKKRAFDRLSIADFGLRKKRAFDRLSATEFGLIKRSTESYPTRGLSLPGH
uniref:Orcokinin peptides type B n=1 Tax=Angiostrongylus cantonensis TaxID=6313 RepID=A0A0K0DCE9_ANGCA